MHVSLDGVCAVCVAEDNKNFVGAPASQDLKPSTKPPHSLIPHYALDGVAQAFADGAEKYEPWNWLEGGSSPRRYLDAAYRHLAAMDPTSNKIKFVEDSSRQVSHLDAAIASLMIYKALAES